jgi:hypothetical protein
MRELMNGGVMLFRVQLLRQEVIRTVCMIGLMRESLNWISALDENLSDIVQTLMARFSSREGYKAFDDAIPTSQSVSVVPYL